MRRALAIAALLASIPAALASAPRSGDFWKPPPPPHSDDDAPANLPKAMRIPGVRHWHYMLRGVPEAYADARSSVPRTLETVRAGAALYARHCAACHGPNGYGALDDRLSLLPSPALLAFLVQKPIAVDEYLLWSIADGGASFDSAMPAFRDLLSRQQIWQIVAYMRAGFPDP
jgi:mono/diheme cytochrome c family protein